MRQGRTGGLEPLVERLDTARAGAGSALLVHGSSVGGSEVVDALVAAAEQWHVVRSSPRATERDLPGAGLSGLLHRLGVALPRLLVDAAQLVDELVTDVGGVDLDRRRRLVALLESAPSDEPVLLVVDDADRLDDVSAELLMSAAARIRAPGLLLVLATDVDDPRLADGSVPTLMVDELDQDRASDLVTGSRDVVPDGAVVAALVRAVEHAPSTLAELVDQLSDDQLAGWRPLPIPLPPAGPEPSELTAVTGAARRALAVVALSCSADVVVISDALARCELGSDVLATAEDARLLRVTDGRVRFRRPALRSHAAAYLTVDERLRAHAALATSLTEHTPDDASCRAHHLVAAGGPSDEILTLLDRAARDARSRGDPLTAARAAADGARHAAEPDDRSALLVRAAADASAGGAHAWAAELARQARHAAAGPSARGAAASVARQLQLTSGSAAEAASAATTEAEHLEHRDPQHATGLYVVAAGSGIVTGQLADARRAAERAVSLAPPGTASDAHAGIALVVLDVLAGRHVGARERLDHHLATLATVPLDDATAFARTAAAVTRTWLGDLEQARVELTALRATLEAGNAEGLLPFPLAALGQVDLLQGWWDDAVRTAHAATELGALEDAGATGQAHVVLALVAAGRGEVDHCAHHARRARRAALLTGAEPLRGFVAAAEGRLALGLRNPSRAATQLEEARRITHGRGLRNAAVLRGAGDLLVALVTSGRRRDAQELLDELETEAARTGHPWTRAMVHRGHALVDLGDDAVERLERADRLLEPTAEPYDRALDALITAGVHLQAGRSSSAFSAASTARERFHALRARPWVTRAERLMHEASRIETPPGGQLASLSAQERRVAGLVSEGRSNRQIATALVVSQKTVEFHLHNIFRKADIRSRTELAELVRAADASGSGTTALT